MINKLTLIIALFLFTLLTADIHISRAQDILRYNGSSTILKGIMYKAARAFEKKEGIKFDLKGKSTGFGIKKLLAGECDIAGGGRPLTDAEKGKGLVETKAFLDAYAVVVHPANPLSEITIDQLRGIMHGKITSWNDLNGPAGKKIVIISPPKKSAHYKFFKKMMGFQELPKNSIVVDMTPNVYKKVKTFPVSIGWLSYSTIMGKKDIKILDIINKGKKCDISPSSVRSGTYPFVKTMYFYTMGQPSGMSKKFIDFMKSDAGKAIVMESGFFNE